MNLILNKLNELKKAKKEGTENKVKFLDLFAGIGGFRLALEQAGHECVGFCEIDKFARKSYKAIHGLTDQREYAEWEWHNVKSLSNKSIRKLRRRVGKIDVISGGYPCQAFSLAGKRRGFQDTRGTLFFEITRIASILKPRYLLLENVTGLLSHEQGNTFETMLRALDELGYDAQWQVHNTKDYLPQNRERIFVVGCLRGERTEQVFPFQRDGRSTDCERRIEKVGNIRKNGTSQSGDVVSIDGIAPTLCSTTTQKDPTKIVVPVLTPDRMEKRQNGRRFKEPGEEMFTLTTQDRHGVFVGDKPANETVVGGLYTGVSEKFNFGVLDGLSRTLKAQSYDAGVLMRKADQLDESSEVFRIRRLTPRECWRLQGFPDWAFDRAKEVNSVSQLYKQAGNSVSIPVVYDIAHRLV